ncbi:MAG: hypothetical protein AAF226_05480 [Verrucomicrobiota bacterium]
MMSEKNDLPRGIFRRKGSNNLYFKLKKYDPVKGKHVWSGPISSQTTDALLARKTRDRLRDECNLADASRGKAHAMTQERAEALVDWLVKWHGGEPIEFARSKGPLWGAVSDDYLTQFYAKAAAKQTKPGVDKFATFKQYRSQLEQFSRFLGEDAADFPIKAISKGIAQDFYNELLAELEPKTCKNIVSTIKRVLERCDETAAGNNPFRSLDMVTANSRKDDPFSLEEVGRIWSGLDELDEGEEWRTAFLFGICLGNRLKDCTSRRWDEISLSAPAHIIYYPNKTTQGQRRGKAVRAPLVDPLLSRLRGMNQEGEFVTPNLAHVKVNGSVGLSEQFMRVLVAQEIPMRVEPPKSDRGLTWNSKGFHSARHTLPSLLAAVGTPESIRMAICGHSSAEVHHGYTHYQDATMRGPLENALEGLRLN